MKNKKIALVCGAGGFIGSHLVTRLKNEGYFVRGADLKAPEFSRSTADEFHIGDLRDPVFCQKMLTPPLDEVYQLAADMGGAGFVFTGENDADIMHNSALINLNILGEIKQREGIRIFYSSSACIYPEYNQMDPLNPKTEEGTSYPAEPDSEYGWEKLFSERAYMAFARNYGITVKIARFHNIFGPEGTWRDGREKAPAAMCRKIAEAKEDSSIEIWGDGQQTRSFLYIDDCLNAVRLLMDSDFSGPVNIGSEEMVSIDELAKMVMEIAAKPLTIHHISGPLGVRGRTSHNGLIREQLNWEPSHSLRQGMSKTYTWISEQVKLAQH